MVEQYIDPMSLVSWSGPLYAVIHGLHFLLSVVLNGDTEVTQHTFEERLKFSR